MTGKLETARYFVMSILEMRKSLGQKVNNELLQDAVDQVLKMPDFEEIDRTLLVNEVEESVNIWMETGNTLEDNSDHLPWLPEKKPAIQWKFWGRYRQYLNEKKTMASSCCCQAG